MMPEPQMPVTPVAATAASKPGSSDHRSRADDLEARLERDGIDAHALDRAGRGALAATDLRALEGRAGRARAGEQAVAVAEHDLGVGADIDQQREFVAAGRAARPASCPRYRRRHGRRCRAAHRRARSGCSCRSSSRPGGSSAAVGRQRERRAAELDRIDAEQQVMHDRIADERRLRGYRLRATPASRATSRGQVVERGAHGRGHLLRAARVHHRIGDPAHQVLAEADLRVHRAAGGDAPRRSTDRTGARRWWSSRHRPPGRRRARASPARAR